MFTDAFSGWTEAFPNKHDTFTVTQKPRCWLPQMIGSDSRPAFVPQVRLANILGIDSKLVYIDPRVQDR